MSHSNKRIVILVWFYCFHSSSSSPSKFVFVIVLPPTSNPVKFDPPKSEPMNSHPLKSALLKFELANVHPKVDPKMESPKCWNSWNRIRRKMIRWNPFLQSWRKQTSIQLTVRLRTLIRQKLLSRKCFHKYCYHASHCRWNRCGWSLSQICCCPWRLFQLSLIR